MSSDDLKQYATSDHDFYALLGVEFEKSEADIKRAYRKAVLKYHPDKNRGDPAATVEKFHLVQTAYEVLTDPAVKAAYDNARAARVQKQRQRDVFDGKRRQMADELERRERGVKRANDGEVDAEERLAREVRRLGEDGKRRRMERDEMLRKARAEGEARADEEARAEGAARAEGQARAEGEARSRVDEPPPPPPRTPCTPAPPRTEEAASVPEIERTVRLRWPRESETAAGGSTLDKSRLAALFSRFGAIETVIPIKEKKLRVGPKREKKLMASACIVYESLASARAAVAESTRQLQPEWPVFESVVILADQNRHPSSVEAASLGDVSSAASTPAKTPPTQSSARSHPAQTPVQGSPFARLSSTGSPSFEQTMQRLKNAEKVRIDAEARRQREAREQEEAVAREVAVDSV